MPRLKAELIWCSSLPAELAMFWKDPDLSLTTTPEEKAMVGRGREGFGEQSLDRCLMLAASFFPLPRVRFSPAPSRAPQDLLQRSARSQPGCASPGRGWMGALQGGHR